MNRNEEGASTRDAGEVVETQSITTPLGAVEIQLQGPTGPDFRFTVRLLPAGMAPALAAEEEDTVHASFNFEGHQIIALVAEKDLAGTATLNKLHEILANDPQGRDRVQDAAVWPDEIRASQPETKGFHFVDIPLQAGGPPSPPLPPEPHVLSKIRDFRQALKDGAGSPEEKADQVSWLFHLFGDVHQPMHCVERYNEFHEGGDRGGNSFRLRGQFRNLHSLWDSSLNIQVDPNTPTDAEGLADAILELHPRSSLEADLQVTDPEKWARATFELAKLHAYRNDLEENPARPPRPSKAYLRNMSEVARRQAALAGYRLADCLRDALGD